MEEVETRWVQCDDMPTLLAAIAWERDHEHRVVMVSHTCDDPIEHAIRIEGTEG